MRGEAGAGVRPGGALCEGPEGDVQRWGQRFRRVLSGRSMRKRKIEDEYEYEDDYGPMVFVRHSGF